MDAFPQLKATSPNTLAKRLLVAFVLLPLGLAVIVIGGAVYAGFVALLLGLAAWEYSNLFHAGGLRPAGVLLVSGALLLVVERALTGLENVGWLLVLLIFGAMAFHLLDYERGRGQPGTDFSITIAGLLYIGWLGAYLISLRFLPDGKWWVLLALPTVWIADSAAFVFGTRFGRHKMSPRLSPKKTWEGYLGGLGSAIVGGALLALVIRDGTGLVALFTLARGALLGLVIGALTPLGDLGESMIKRQVGAKDSGNLLPGHGGIFDRIDSWLWAAPISYYLIVWFFLS